MNPAGPIGLSIGMDTIVKERHKMLGLFKGEGFFRKDACKVGALWVSFKRAVKWETNRKDVLFFGSALYWSFNYPERRVTRIWFCGPRPSTMPKPTPHNL
jgi:hypothetical protein